MLGYPLSSDHTYLLRCAPWGNLRTKIAVLKAINRRRQQSSGLRRGPMTYRLLRLRDRIPPETWMSASCECCVLSSRGL